VRLIAKPSRNSESIPPFLSKLVNNGLPLLLTKFIKSRRQGLSERTINFYEYCLEPFVNNYEFSSEGINQFLTDLTCGNVKHAYYRSLRVFSNWAYREGYIKENPIKKVDSPKCIEVILPSLTHNQVLYLIKEADTLRDKCIISLFADSGMRLRELCSIEQEDINWEDNTVTIWGKGSIQRKGPFTQRTARLLRQLISKKHNGFNIWHLKPWKNQTAK